MSKSKSDFIPTIEEDFEQIDEDEEEEEEEEIKSTKSGEDELDFDFDFASDNEGVVEHSWDFTSAKKSLRTDGKVKSLEEKIQKRLDKKREEHNNEKKRKQEEEEDEEEQEEEGEEKEEKSEKKREEEEMDHDNDEEEDDDDDDDEEEDEEDEDEEDEELEQDKKKKQLKATKKEEESEESEESEEEEDDEEKTEVKRKDKSKKTNKKDKQEENSDQEDIESIKKFFGEAPKLESQETFEDLNLSKPLLKAIHNLGWKRPTPIQSQTIPLALSGKDVVGSAVTGSGKTAAFVLPILERLLYLNRRIPVTRALILIPTRELAVQCHSTIEKLARYTPIKCALVIGGLSNVSQETDLRRFPDIIVGTPGRVIDHLRNAPSFSLDDIEYLILDEADRLLELGFTEEVEEIVKSCPKSRQSLLFSATMTAQVDQLIKLSLDKPIRVSVDPIHGVADTLSQEFIKVKSENQSLREAMLLALCEKTVKKKAIIFFPQKWIAHRFRIIFGLAGLSAAELHGNLTQLQRLEALEKFRDGEVNYLLVTDLASRGLDILGIETVINYQMPKNLTDYIHRVGRTARAGEKGRSISFVLRSDRSVLKKIIKKAKENVKRRVLDSTLVEKWKEKIEDMKQDIAEILGEEKQEKEIRLAEMEMKKTENMLVHEDEIYSRPKKTWFISEKVKKQLKEKRKEISESQDDDTKETDKGKKKKEKAEKKKKKKLEERKKERKEKIQREKQKELVQQKVAKKRQRQPSTGAAKNASAKAPPKKKIRTSSESAFEKEIRTSKFSKIQDKKIQRKKKSFNSKKKYKRR